VDDSRHAHIARAAVRVTEIAETDAAQQAGEADEARLEVNAAVAVGRYVVASFEAPPS